MKNKITLQAIITTIRAKVDRSLSLSLSTPELTPEQKTIFFNLQGLNLDISITPSDFANTEEVKIDKDLNHKSQSQRIRAILYILYQQSQRKISYEEYYKVRTEEYIDQLKGEIE